MRMVVVRIGWLAASVLFAAVATPQQPEPHYRVRNAEKIAALGISDKDVKECAGVARSFLTKWTDINPGIFEVKPNLYGQPRLEFGQGIEWRLEVDYKSKEVRSFFCSDEGPSAAKRMTEGEALKRMALVAQSLGLPVGAALAETHYRSSGTAKTLARDLYHATYGFKKEGVWVPASYVHLSMNLRTGKLSLASVDRRKYVVDSSEGRVTRQAAEKTARRYAIDHKLVHHSDNPDPGKAASFAKLYFEKGRARVTKPENVKAHFRLAWLFRYRTCQVFVDATTGEVLGYDTCR